MLAPLLGRNLVRLLYLDETGTTSRADCLAVAGVIVHGDQEWPQVDTRLAQLIEKYIPEKDRLEFVFHATDIFHGSGYFDRRKPEWASEEKRWPILFDLAQILTDLSLPVVAGFQRKPGPLTKEENHSDVAWRVQNASAVDCLVWADRWLAKYAPEELATVVHEDGAPAKNFIKYTVRVLRSNELLASHDFDERTKSAFGLPLRRIIDTVHFAEKAEARPLQLADLCAFILGRAMHQKPIPFKLSFWGPTK